MSKDIPITEKEHALIPKALTHEIYLLYTLTMALDAMVIDIEKRFREVNATFHFEKEAKMYLTRYFELLEKCKTHYENFICPGIIKTTKDTGYKSYEDSRIYAQELIRLLMLYYTQCGKINNHKKVFDFIASLEGGNGIFTAEDINRFNLGCK